MRLPCAGFESIDAVFDQAHRDRVLPMVHTLLLRKAAEKYRQVPWHRLTRLFYNLDSRLFSPDNYDIEVVNKALDRECGAKGKLCYEISEQHEIGQPWELTQKLAVYRTGGIRIALDDFGVGFSGLRLLYFSRPDYIKIDRFFIRDISHDQEKRMLAGSIVAIAHQMGSLVIAEGVESEQEYYECRNLGCDMVQGYLVQKPQLDTGKLRKNHAHVLALCEKDKRIGGQKDISLLQAEIEYIRPIQSDAPPIDLLEAFKNDPLRTFFPIVTATN